MTPKVKIIVGVVAGVVGVAAAATTAGLLLSKKKVECPEACLDLPCGAECEQAPGCPSGTYCDDPETRCEGGVCLKNYACSPDGACVPDPLGPFKGDTCRCYDVKVSGDGVETCELVGDVGVFKSQSSCEARDSDFECVPGTGTCERVLGASTGWREEGDCRCFECPATTLSCVPTQQSNPGEAGIDGAACETCGWWKCDGGACVQVREGGEWASSQDCSCAACVDGACSPIEGGGIYPSLASCEADGAQLCSSPNLGWACSASAGNDEACEQVIGGTASSLEACRCWTCDGVPPGPTSGCVIDYSNSGEYPSFSGCLLDEERKCGWKYECAYSPE